MCRICLGVDDVLLFPTTAELVGELLVQQTSLAANQECCAAHLQNIKSAADNGQKGVEAIEDGEEAENIITNLRYAFKFQCCSFQVSRF